MTKKSGKETGESAPEHRSAVHDLEERPDPSQSGRCPFGQAVELLGARWPLVLVRHLLNGPQGFQTLCERVGLSPRALSTRLKQLIDQDLVEKVPVGNRSHYALTERGMSLEPVVREVALWWITNGMGDSEGLEDAPSPATLAALSSLLRDLRGHQRDLTCDFHVTVRNGAISSIETSRVSAPAHANGREDPTTSPTQAPAGREALDGYAGGAIAWYPDWPDRPDRTH
jgi:DNA-binding HxlR family transcriptional regulator